MKIEWKTCFRVGITLFLLYLCIQFCPYVGDFILALLGAASPLLIGCVIAFLVNILMSFYEKRYFPKTRKKFLNKSRRPVCLLLAFITLVVVVALVCALIIPQLISCVQLIFEELPGAIKFVIAKLEEWNILTDEVVDSLSAIDWKSRIGQIIEVITSGIGNVVGVLISTVSSVFSGIVTALIAVIFSVYLLMGKDKLKNQAEVLMDRYLKKTWVEKINHVLSVMNDCFRRYIIGQCTEALILGGLCTVGMLILSLPYAAMVGALIAFTALIPVAGAYIGAFVGAFMILTESPLKAIIFLVFIVVLQQLEGNIIYPRVVGSSLGLPGIWVLAAVTVGGGVMGIMGMLIGVPLAATAYRLLRENVSKPKKPKIKQEAK